MKSSKCNIKFKWDAHVFTQKTSKQKMIAFLALIKFCEILMRNNSTTAFQGNLWGLNSSRTGKFFFRGQNMTNIEPNNLPSFCINSVYTVRIFFFFLFLEYFKVIMNEVLDIVKWIEKLTSLLWHCNLPSPLKNTILPMYNWLDFA